MNTELEDRELYLDCMEPRPTTTCAHCGQDFHDRSLIPLDDGGELCHDCMDRLRDAAPDLLAALVLLLPHAARWIGGTTDGEPVLTRAKTAIAKATT